MATLRDIDKFMEWDPSLRIYKPVFWRRNLLPYQMGFVESDVPFGRPFTIPAAGGLAPPVHFKQPYSSVEGLDDNLGNPLAIQSIVFADSTDGTAAADFAVMLKEVGETREFMNREVHIRTIAGTAQQVGLLREPYFFMSQHTIQAQFRKIAGGAVNIRMYLNGAQYYPWDPNFLLKPKDKEEIVARIRAWINRRRYVSPYWLTTDTPVALGANATGDFPAKVGDDGHFECFGLTAVATGNFSLELSEVKTKQTLMNGAITQTNGIGNARFPTIFFQSYVVPAGYRLNCRLTDLSGAPNAIWLTMFGRKVFVPFRRIEEVIRKTGSVITGVQTMVDTPTPMVPKPI